MLNNRKFTYFFHYALLPFILFLTMMATCTAGAANIKEPVNIKVEVNTLNIRTGPAINHTCLQKLPLGTPLQVLYRDKDWLLVKLNNGHTGWVSGQYTSFSTNMVDKLPPVLGEKVLVKVSGGNLLNVRLGAGLNCKVIKQLGNNTAVTVYFHEGDWLLVRLADGSSGWIHAGYTTFVLPDPGSNQYTGDIPAGSQDANPQSLAEQTTGMENESNITELEAKDKSEPLKEALLPYQVIISENSLCLREEPDLKGTPITTLPRDTVLTVQQETEDNWLQVTITDGQQGWIAGWCTQIYAGKGENYFRLATVTADVLKVRSGPGLQYEQTGRVFSGNHVLALKEQDGWHYIRVPDGSYGWICSDYATVKNIASRSDTGTGRTLTQAITIMLDPGHGGKDCGATGHSGLKEKDVNLTVALHTANLLRAKGFNVILTRSDDQYITLAERVTLAEKKGADLFISIHANASLNNKFASGTETYYFPNKDSAPQSFFLASLIQQEVSSSLNLPSIGVKKDSFHVIRETYMPSALVELAFLSNAVDETVLRSGECLQLAAGALYRAVMRYYNLM